MMITKNIPYEDLKKVNAPYFDSMTKIGQEVIENGWYILGDKVTEFEKEFSKINNSNYCIGVASGLDALILGLEVFDFKQGSKVLVPSNTYIASILAIIKAGLIPVLVEPDQYTYNITKEGIEKKYSEDCVAILVVHLYGRLCQMPEIMNFASNKKLKVIEDCAQSHFAEMNGTKAGTFGDIGAFSFYPTKNLGAIGDGGAILCKDEQLSIKLKALRNYGSHQKYNNKYVGINSRLDEIQAAFLLAKLPDYKNIIKHKKQLAEAYLYNLAQIKEITLPLKSGTENVWHIFNIIVPDRDSLKRYLFENNIGTEIHYPIPPHKQEGYLSYFKNESYPISEFIHEGTLSLPISICHSVEDINYISSHIVSFYTK
jgi:dTDP-4-amino-4,6-dideoxygalactose transaminase